MGVDWELEDWLLDAGEQVTHKLIEHGPASLTPTERLIQETWLLDMETRNGGVSQYFCNRGLVQWQALREAWQAVGLPGLEPIIAEIERITRGTDDPYQATLDASPAVEEFYELHQGRVKAELRRLMASTS